MTELKKDVKNVAKYGIIITILLVLSKLTGFAREFIVAIQLGTTREADIFKTASAMPQVFFSAVAAALVTTFIPIFSNIKNDKEKANKFFNNVLNIVTIVCFILSIIAIVVSPQLVSLFAGGFKGNDFNITVQLTQILMPSIIFLGMSGLYTGYLQSYGKFVQPALTGITANVVIIIGLIVFYKTYGLMAAIISVFVGAIAQAFTQRPFMGNDYKYEFVVDLKDSNVRKMLTLAIPILISSAVSQINLMVARNFASNLVAGSISVIDYASKFSTIINQVFIVSITTVLYPKLTEKYSQNDLDGFKELFVKSVNLVIMVAIPLIFGLAVLSKPIIQLVLERGKFDKTSTELTSMCLKYLAFSALGYSLMDILGKVFFAMKNTVTPMINGFILVVVNIIFTLVLGSKMGVNGLALATTLSVTILALILFIEIKIRIKGVNYKKIFISFLKMLSSGVVMALAVGGLFSLIDNFLPKNNMFLGVNIIICTLVGACVYTIMLIIFRVDELKELINLKRKK
ncbi:murein biosynthesis integral membrane protein MurJ [uncultured Clostridium sp.]|uniref:murein biosynthesis integral membrane protein MurJ n=1 Tax=uncultured Clostridium sp. TaxID=59620 RepID=UPI0028E4F00A|nr:murein biosynthesis integral membrane protein MurJ [uncultured Clostridium sp.]